MRLCYSFHVYEGCSITGIDDTRRERRDAETDTGLIARWEIPLKITVACIKTCRCQKSGGDQVIAKLGGS